jgi:hypothetical protein
MGRLGIGARELEVLRATKVLAGLFVLASVGACSVINDSTVTQCKTNDDCMSRFGADLGVSCVDTFCVQPACTSDDQCKRRGDRYTSTVCGMSGFCTTSNSVGAACTKVADCNSLSPTVECIAGRCDDKIWGCAGHLDERPPAMMPSATLQGRVIDFSTRQPVPELNAHACLLPSFDPDCTRPLPGTSMSYDLDAGQVTVTGVPQDTPIRLKIDFPLDSGLIPLDQYSARTAHDLTNLPTLATLPIAASSNLTALLDPPRVRKPEAASITAVAINCVNEAALGVQFRIAEADKIDGTEVLYFGADGQLDPNATATEAFGSALIINVKPAKLVTLQTWAGNLLINEYRVLGFPHRSTAVHFFPRVYPDATNTGM